MKKFLIVVSFFLIGCKDNVTPKVESQHIEAEMEKIELDTMGKAYLMGKFDPKTDIDFVKIDRKYADREGLYLRKEVLRAYQEMHKQASKDGIQLVIKSATRNFDYQKRIWERKWTGETTLSDGVNLGKSNLSNKEKALKILEYSSMPGTSRHHWGTDFDLNAFENKWFESGEGKKVFDWLQNHASKFGFVQVYTPKGPERPNGYNEEKWHWSYKPTSSKYLEEAKMYLSNLDIMGFKGAETADEIDVLNNYILGVSKDCF